MVGLASLVSSLVEEVTVTTADVVKPLSHDVISCELNEMEYYDIYIRVYLFESLLQTYVKVTQLSY